MVQLELTEAATRKAKGLLAASDQPGGALRVAVRNGGCSGMRYELLFDRERRPDDDQLEFDGLQVVVDPESAPYLEGVRIDYSDALNDAGFKIENPKASETCGCGESFSL
jgi:iron-sulfur cluster assembly protein